jgi:transaldolase
MLAMASALSPLQKMVSTTKTDLWIDSCAVAEVKYSLEHGAVGATSNPTIVCSVMQQEFAEWRNRLAQHFQSAKSATETEITWKIIEEMAVRGAELLMPVFTRTAGKKGRLSLQTNPEFHSNPAQLIAQAHHFAKLAPNIQVKLPTTEAGLTAMEEVTASGINVNATVCFTVPQAVAVAEAIQRGLTRREAAGHSTADMAPVCTLMVGRLDDWLKVCAEKQKLVPTPGTLDWAGIACIKRAYGLYQSARFRTRLLAAAYRNHLHWSELIGGDVILTIPAAWQRRFNASSLEVRARMDDPVPPQVLTELAEQLEDFRRAYDTNGLKPAEFDSFGATRRTLRTFIGSYYELVGIVRDVRLPDPDV